MSKESVSACASFSLAWRVNLLVAFEASVASRPGTGLVVTSVHLCIGITQFDGNISLQLVLESDGLHSRNSLDNS